MSESTHNIWALNKEPIEVTDKWITDAAGDKSEINQGWDTWQKIYWFDQIRYINTTSASNQSITAMWL